MIKNGTRLASQVCDTQVIVVRSADSLDDLRCGGVPMVADRRRAVGRTRPGVRRRHRDGQALCRRNRRRGAGDQAGCGKPERRPDRASAQRGQAAAGQRLTVARRSVSLIGEPSCLPGIPLRPTNSLALIRNSSWSPTWLQRSHAASRAAQHDRAFQSGDRHHRQRRGVVVVEAVVDEGPGQGGTPAAQDDAGLGGKLGFVVGASRSRPPPRGSPR